MESQNTEYKSNWRDEYLKVVCAFANAEGGNLIIGIDDRGNPVGIKDAKKLLEDLPNKVRNKLGIIPSVEIKKRKDKEIINIITNPSSVPISYDGKYYIRSGSTVMELRGNDLANFLMKKLGRTWDDFIEERASFDDLNPETIEKFKKLAEDRIPSIIREKSHKAILEKLNLMDKGIPKRAAILLFGKNPQRFYPQAFLKIGRFLNETDIVSSDIVEGNLFEQLENTHAILRNKYLISDITFEGIHRRDILEYPDDALREGIINALIHRDYVGSSSTQVRVYSDKFVIMNEGKLPPEVPLERLKIDHLSKPRNVLLAKVFYFAGLIESWGRGTIRIVENCLKHGLPEPDFIEESGVMKIIFYKEIWTEEKLKKSGLNERQIKAIMYVKEEGKITNRKYQELCNTSERTATRDLTNLVNKAILEQIGITGKGTSYILKAPQSRQSRHNDATKPPGRQKE